jgi:hypothetical protein
MKTSIFASASLISLSQRTPGRISLSFHGFVRTPGNFSSGISACIQ